MAYQVFLTNGKDVTKFTKYLSASPDFSIEKSSLDKDKSGTFLLDDGRLIAAIYGTSPTDEQIQVIGKMVAATFVYRGRSDDYIAIPRSVRDRVLLMSKLLLQFKKLWLVENNRLIAVTEEDIDTRPALIGSLIRGADGIFLHPLPFFSVYN